MSQLKIYARVRLNRSEGYKRRPMKITSREQNIHLFQEKTNVTNQRVIKSKEFQLDKIYDIDYNNYDIYAELGSEILQNTYMKKSSVFYVYGQTGSGKTYSLLGNDDTSGIITYMLQDLTKVYSNVTYNGIQVYNNKCYDIFNENALIKECETRDGSIQFMNITKHTLNHDTLDNMVDKIKKARHVGVSSSNDVSSRSHLIIQMFVNGSYIMMVDLAGSERACRSQFNHEKNMRENADINLGILALKECIRGVRKKKVPYRNSKITKILKETFSAKVNTYILATISPLHKDIQDSLDTLKYMCDFKRFKPKALSPKKPIPLYHKDYKDEDHMSDLYLGIKKELSKEVLQHTKIIHLIEDNIKSLEDLRLDILEQKDNKHK